MLSLSCADNRVAMIAGSRSGAGALQSDEGEDGRRWSQVGLGWRNLEQGYLRFSTSDSGSSQERAELTCGHGTHPHCAARMQAACLAKWMARKALEIHEDATSHVGFCQHLPHAMTADVGGERRLVRRRDNSKVMMQSSCAMRALAAAAALALLSRRRPRGHCGGVAVEP